MRCRTREAVSGTRGHIGRSTRSTADTSTSPTGMSPMRGKACCSSVASHWAVCFGLLHPSRFASTVAFAASRKVTALARASAAACP